MTILSEFSLPIVDLQSFLKDGSSSAAISEAKKVAEALHLYGAVIVKDPRVTEQHNEEFLSLLERYFSQPEELKLLDARPEYAYQVGVTPELIETPKCTFDPVCLNIIEGLPDDSKPHIPSGPDPKWRFFWRIGDRPEQTEFKELNAEPVIPAAFPQWPAVMNKWGSLMHGAVSTVSEMLAVGFGLPIESFSKMTANGPHLLAPTASDLAKYSALDTIFAGFHYDLNFLTIHGKSRYPGLLIWSRTGERIQVRIPDGCLLIQAGKQIEYLTVVILGGHVSAGYHEVVVLPDTLRAVERARNEGRPLWRISSTLFFHVASDQILIPLGKFQTKEALEKYRPILTGKQVENELKSINLKK